MVQVPGATAVTVLPPMVQMPGVVLLNVTARPELALAETAAVPGKLNAGAAPKLMVCDRASMAGPLPTPPPQAASSNVASAAVPFPDFIPMKTLNHGLCRNDEPRIFNDEIRVFRDAQ